MKILAFDTSSRSGSVALLDDGNLVREITAADAHTHALWLMPAIRDLLDGCGLDVSSVGLFALTVGPGSFTGLRIGVSTAKGLAWPLHRKVMAVSTLESLALNLRFSGMTVCPMLDARKGEVYTALYRFSGKKMEAVLRDTLMAPKDLFALLSSGDAPTGQVAFLGNGAAVYKKEIEGAVKDAHIVPEPLWHIRASNVALIAYEGLLSGRTPLSPSELLPVYLRKSEAEIKGKAPPPPPSGQKAS